jgi:fibronectin type 3 domain-containing protein
VQITWNASSGATGYEIWRNTSDTTNSAGLLGTATSTTYDDTTATAGTTYYYWLKASNSYGTSPFSSSDSGYRRASTPGQVAFATSSYTVNENAGSIALTVTRSLGSDGAASVNYSTQNGTASAGTDYTSASGTLSWSDGDSAGKTITVTIINRSGKQDNRAFTVGLSGASGAALASPYTATVTISDVWPSTPTGVIASDGTYMDNILIGWNSAASATSYKVWRGTDNNAQNASVLGTCTISYYLDTAATAGTIYYYWIQAVNEAGTSDLSAPDSGYCGSLPSDLAIPRDVNAGDGAYTDRIPITWQAVNGAMRYEIWRAVENNLSAATPIGKTAKANTSYNDHFVSPGISYYYWVRASNAKGYGGYGSPDSGWCRLSAPSGMNAGDGLHPYHINVAWSPVANTLWYEVWREEVPGANSVGGNLMNVAQTTDTYFNDYYTKAGVYYRYKVKACNGLCASDYSSDTGVRQVATAQRALPPENDYDGDKLSDLALFNSSSGVLDVLCSALGQQTFTLGTGPSQGATGDIDGDQKMDPLAYYADSGTWLARLSRMGYNPIIRASFGGDGNDPVTADFDGDRVADIGVYNETDGVLSVILSNGGDFDIRASCLMGGPGYSFVSADFDGDGKADPTVYSESEGRAIVAFSGSGYYCVDFAFGGPGQSMYSADFDGDAKADPMLYEGATGQWTALLSSAGYSVAGLSFGGPGYVPAIGDYDGDGLADPAIYRESDGQWLIMFSSGGYSVLTETFGGANFIPFGPEK